MSQRMSKVSPSRDAHAWRQLGYRTIFRHGCIVLVEAARGAELRGPEPVWIRGIDGGDWMNEVNLSRGSWRAMTVAQLDQLLRADVLRVVRACYCDTGCKLCDFCGGVRQPTNEETVTDATLRREVELLDKTIAELETKLAKARAARDRKAEILRARV